MVAVNNLYSSRMQLMQKQQQVALNNNYADNNVSLFDYSNDYSYLDNITPGMLDGSCVDGQDDGKIGLKEGLKSFGKGVLNFAKKALNPKNVVKGVAVGVGLAALNVCLPGVGTAITGALIVGGAVKGGAQVAKGIGEAANATTDAEKRQALENMGEGTATVVSSAVAAKGFKSATGKSVTDINMYKDAASTTATAAKQSFGNLTQAMKPSSIKANLQTKAASLKENFNFTEDQQTFMEMMKEDPTATMDAFGKEFMPQISKSVAQGFKTTATNSIAQAKQFVQSAASNMSVDNMVTKLGEMGINKVEALNLIKQTAAASINNENSVNNQFYYM